MLISPTEPFPIKGLGKVSSVPERYGCDVMIIKQGMRTGIQRKKFPDDLLASLADGRLYTQVHQMATLDRALLVVEGYGQWTGDGQLLDMRSFTKAQMYGLFFSLAWEFGIEVLQVRDINQTIELLNYLEIWAGKKKHNSLRQRPGPTKDSWGSIGVREYGAHFLQSFPGVGPELAGRIFDHFGRVPVKWDLTGPEELMAIRGIGKDKAQRIWKVLGYDVATE